MKLTKFFSDGDARLLRSAKKNSNRRRMENTTKDENMSVRVCERALTPAQAWALIFNTGVVRWCDLCKRFRAGKTPCGSREPEDA